MNPGGSARPRRGELEPREDDVFRGVGADGNTRTPYLFFLLGRPAMIGRPRVDEPFVAYTGQGARRCRGATNAYTGCTFSPSPESTPHDADVERGAAIRAGTL
jgi:hypothetical protein